MEVVAIDRVAEKVLQTTTTDMTRLPNFGHKLELDSIKAEFRSKKFLVFLSRTASKASESNRRLLLESYYEDSAPLAAIEANQTASTEASSSNNKDTYLPVSLLKRQLSGIMITPGKLNEKATDMDG